MKNISPIMSLRLSCFVMFALISGIQVESGLAQQYNVTLRRSNDQSAEPTSAFTVNTDFESFSWTTVEKNGATSKSNIRLDTIKELVLTPSPNSEGVAQLRKFVANLGSDDWQERKQAEAELSKQDVGGPYYNLIKLAAAEFETSDNDEASYRLERILKKLKKPSQQASTGKFDVIVMKNGKKIRGDAGNFILDCESQGRSLKLSRKNILRIGEAKGIDAAITKTNTAAIDVRMFHDPKGEFYLPEQTNIDFDKDESGATYPLGKDAREMFADQGLILEAEMDPIFLKSTPDASSIMTMVNTYDFGGNPFPSSRSICVSFYSKRQRRVTKYKGVMLISFCLPNQPSVPASVKEFGLYMKSIEGPRDFLLEAYNAEGQLLSSVESTDKTLSFFGVKSNEPIAQVQLRSNHYLRDFITKNQKLFKLRLRDNPLEECVDLDGAVDNICIDTPVAITTPSATTASEMTFVRLMNNDVYWCKETEFDNAGNIKVGEQGGKPIMVPLDEVRSIRFPVEKKTIAKKQNGQKAKFISPVWRAMLHDGSVLDVTPGEKFEVNQINQELDRDQIRGIFASSNPVRIPASGDFDQGKFVAMFPWCRIPTDEVSITKDGFSWPKTEPLFQPVDTITRDESETELYVEKPQPQTNEVSFTKTSAPDVPSLWFSHPTPRHPRSGLIRLKDGQQMVLWDSSFKLVKMTEQGIVLAYGDVQQEFEWAQVASMELPIKE